MHHALIIGCGYTGVALAKKLQARGVQVDATGLTGAQVEGVHIRAMDLRRPEALDFSGAEQAVVYYLVSTLERRYDPQSKPHLQPLEAALTALKPHPISGLIYLSSTSVYGDQQGGWVDEETPPAPSSPWGQMRLDLEQRVAEYGDKRSIPACVVRSPEIYGPRRGPVARLREGYALRFPHRHTNRIHVEDLSEVLAELGERLDLPLLLAADGCTDTAEEVYTYAASLLGMTEVPRSHREIRDPNRLGLARDSKRCRNHKLLHWLGRPLRYPSYIEGLPHTL